MNATTHPAPPQVVTLTAQELDTLHGVGPLGFTLYVLLRTWMDYGTGVTGRSRPVSLGMLASYSEMHTPRGKGLQVTQESEKAIRLALDRLTRAGLLRRIEGERLLFLLPLAQIATVRPNHTGHFGGTLSSTEPGSPKAVPALAEEPEPGTKIDLHPQAYRAHIKYQVNVNPYPRSVDKSGQGQRPACERAIAGTSAEVRCVRGLARLLHLGQKRGLPPRPGENWKDYRTRILRPRQARQQDAGG